MVGKKKIALILCSLLAVTSLVACGKKEEAKKKIGITQIVAHPALDSARKGFLDALKEKGYEDGKNITVDYQNAQGDISTANTIAQGFVSDKKDLILAIATPTAQAAYNSTKDIPIVFTAVTDPVDAGLVKDAKKPGTNVTGTSDYVSIGDQIKYLKKILPNAKTVGVIYNTSEANSMVQVKTLKEEAAKVGLTVKEAGVTSVNDIDQSLNSILGSIDVLYTPTDNTIASSYDLVGKRCLEKKVPIFGAESAVVEKGGLVTAGIDYYELGKQAGYKAADILGGKKPQDIEVGYFTDLKVTINTDAAKKLGITIPDDILKDAEKVTGGVN
ncbi:ABC transporter substrate-binding protein [Clostridium sp. 'White wine YQ']|uniref:ABC transporter substrate-binding protein n=1 Tax=Clostridium sp. 'White wine YQ' TaxID=3027474 RepID=UPI0023660117|nr:ABC transporter substrate-binding protein [Clostridium sp. 'White wine YQ']MDD7793291.1 ABC transporter substrate-binding protein [Clostridium sp. 'White wine YQ']